MAELTARRLPPPLTLGPLLRLLPRTARFSLRGAAELSKAAEAVLGFELPQQACRSVRQREYAALWLGPDERLLLLPESQAEATVERLRAALQGLRHSLVDISHRQLALQLEGAAAALALNVGCPLDLDATAFPVGMCTRTVLGKAEIVLWRTAADAFHIEVWRSFADYVVCFLNEATRELAC
ncbi:MAG: hypothetical protein JOY91_13230 [Sinobacteraceae bacterium]|nr:hypothetical protein [Nevskiaceae bacterium]